MTLITQAQTRKERRKQERKKRKQQHGRQHQTVVEKEPDLVPKLKKSKKDETSKVVKQAEIDPYGTLNPDEAAAMEGANAWLTGSLPAGRPYEVGADTSGYVIGSTMIF